MLNFGLGLGKSGGGGGSPASEYGGALLYNNTNITAEFTTLNGVSSASNILNATAYEGTATTIPLSGITGTIIGLSSAVDQFEAALSYATIATNSTVDTLVTQAPLANGDNIVIVLDDDTIVESVASGVTVNPGQETDLTVPNGAYFNIERHVYNNFVGPNGEARFPDDPTNTQATRPLTDNNSGSFPLGGNGWVYEFNSSQRVQSMTFINGQLNSTYTIQINGSTDGINYSPMGSTSFMSGSTSITYTITMDSSPTIKFFQLIGSGDGFGYTDINFRCEQYVTDPYSTMDTSAITNGEIPSRVYVVDNLVSFNGSVASIAANNYTIAGAILSNTRGYANRSLIPTTSLVTTVGLFNIDDKLTSLGASVMVEPSPPTDIIDFSASAGQTDQITMTWSASTGIPDPVYSIHRTEGLIADNVTSPYVFDTSGETQPYSSNFWVTASNSSGTVTSNTSAGDSIAPIPDLVVNGTFPTDVSGWTVQLGTLTWQAPNAARTGSGGGTQAIIYRTLLQHEVGTNYEYKFTFLNVQNGGGSDTIEIALTFGGSGVSFTSAAVPSQGTSVTLSGTFVMTEATPYAIQVKHVGSGGGTGFIGDLSTISVLPV